MMGVAFHPELSDDARLHEYFLEMVRAAIPGITAP
jgi:glutamine amidotransferase PdxT